jgi:hypothetical protein
MSRKKERVMTRTLGIVFLGTVGSLAMACASGSSGSDPSESASPEVVAAHGVKIKNFECTAVASSASDAHLKTTRIDITADETAAGVPTGALVTGFEASLHASFALGFGTSHVRDTTASGHSVSEYKIDFGADGMLQGATGGTLTIPTVFTRFALESSAALNVATLTLTPSNATVTYKCKKDTRKTDNGSAPDPLVFEGAAKDVVAKDSCAKDVAADVMDALVEAIEDHGVDVPDSFVFTKIDKTSDGFKMVVNGVTVPVVVGSGCSVKKIDTSAAGSLGE